jgi:hypothetical protein
MGSLHSSLNLRVAGRWVSTQVNDFCAVRLPGSGVGKSRPPVARLLPRHGAGRLNLSPLGAGSELLCSITVTVHINIVLCAHEQSDCCLFDVSHTIQTSHSTRWQAQRSLYFALKTNKQSESTLPSSVPKFTYS